MASLLATPAVDARALGAARALTASAGLALLLSLPAATPLEAATRAATALALLLLLVGLHARLAALAALPGLLALAPDARPLQLALLLAALLPSAAGLSLDALLRSFRSRRELDAAELEERALLPRAPTAGGAGHGLALRVALAVALVAVSFAPGARFDARPVLLVAIGFAPTAELQRLSSGGLLILGLAALGLAPLAVLQSLTAAGLLVLAVLSVPDGATPALLFFASAVVTLAPAHARALARRAFAPRPLTLFFDADCGVCFLSARLIARLDPLHAIRFVPTYEHALLPPGVSPELAERTIVAVDGAGRQSFRSDAFAAVFARLPLLAPLGWLLRTPGLRALWLRAYDAFAARRRDVSVRLGLAACGLRAPASLPRDAVAPTR